MTQESGDRELIDVVLTGAGLDEAERRAYLQGVAAKDPGLAEEAARRLAAAEELPDSFLETPAVARLKGATDHGTCEPPAPASGAALPVDERYELAEQVGEGGMGRVFKAFDRQLGRTVALKFLTHSDPHILQRFLREARAQARVRHEHVLDVYDSGEIDGQPFIATQYVDGGTLEDNAAGLSVQQKVRLLAQAARGLHAAHLEGLLHRDVKPSNILVQKNDNGSLQALVTDFGLAKDLSDADLTDAEDVVGSPQYIAPERLMRGSAPDQRADIYSLGMASYHLLAGALPWAGEGTLEALRRTIQQDLPSPRLLQPGLPKELEAVILRCTARDSDQRYRSALAVAKELERYLRGEIVEAYAAGLAYRLIRFVLRNRAVSGLAALFVVATCLFSVGLAVFAWRADQARERAELRHGQAEELIRFMLFDLRDKLESLGRLDVLADAGDAATRYFAAVPKDELSEAELLRRSRMLYQVGDVRIRQGDLAGAWAPMTESLELAQRLSALQPKDGERLFELGQAHFWVGFVAWERGDLAAAREAFEAYLEVSRRLVSQEPDHPAWKRELSYAHSNLGSLREAEGDLEGALREFLATLALDRELLAAEPGDDEIRFELAASHNTVGVILQKQARLDEAERHFRADLEIRRALLAADPAAPRAKEFFGTSHSYLGKLLLVRGQIAKADESFRAMHEVFTELVDYDADNSGWRYKLAWSLTEIGRVACVRGELETADAAWREAQELVEVLLALDATPHDWRRTRAVLSYHRAIAQAARGDGAARDTARGAVQALEDLAAERPTDPRVRRWLAWSSQLLEWLDAPATVQAMVTQSAELCRAEEPPPMSSLATASR